ncbi:MAG: carboxypeptidase-like regulatory domain-containing protein [Candidatus Marithrix sp.]
MRNIKYLGVLLVLFVLNVEAEVQVTFFPSEITVIADRALYGGIQIDINATGASSYETWSWGNEKWFSRRGNNPSGWGYVVFDGIPRDTKGTFYYDFALCAKPVNLPMHPDDDNNDCGRAKLKVNVIPCCPEPEDEEEEETIIEDELPTTEEEIPPVDEQVPLSLYLLPMIEGIAIEPKPVTTSDTQRTRSLTNSFYEWLLQKQTTGFERSRRYRLSTFLSENYVLNFDKYEENYEIELSYSISENGSYNKETTILSKTTNDKSTISYETGTTLFGYGKIYYLSIGSEFPVGNVRITAKLRDKSTGQISSPVSTKIGVIFNAFEGSEDKIRHSTEALSTAQLGRYVVYDKENIHYGDKKNERELSPHDEDRIVFDKVMDFVSELHKDDRILPENVALKLQNKANEILCGCWQGIGNTCESGTTCNSKETSADTWLKIKGVKAIVEKYNSTSKPVKYAQCPVYGAVTNAFFRASGIPSRTILNGEIIGTYSRSFSPIWDKPPYDESANRWQELIVNGKVEYKNISQESWNYHVWNEAYISDKSPGWVVYDASNRLSKGADLFDIKESNTNDGIKTSISNPERFVYEEVNVPAKFIFEDLSGNITKIDSESHISTTLFSTSVDSVGNIQWSNHVEDYRYTPITTRRGTIESEQAIPEVDTAISVDTEISLGKDVPFTIITTNNDSKKTTLNLLIKVRQNLSERPNIIFSDGEEITLKQSESHTYTGTIPYTLYEYAGNYAIDVVVIDPTKETALTDSESFEIIGLQVDYSGSETVNIGESFVFQATVSNHSQFDINDAAIELGIDEDDFTATEALIYANQSIAAGEQQTLSWNITAINGGEHRVGAIASSQTIGTTSIGYYLPVIDGDLTVFLLPIEPVAVGETFTVNAIVINNGLGEMGGRIELALNDNLSTTEPLTIDFAAVQPENQQILSWNVVASEVGSLPIGVTITDTSNRTDSTIILVDTYTYHHEMTISSDQNEIASDQESTITLTVNNLGSQEDTITLQVSKPFGINVSLSDDETITVPANGMKTITATINPNNIAETVVITAKSLLDASAVYSIGINILGEESEVGQFSVSGYIFDEYGNPLADVLIKVDGQTVMTDENGYYQINELEESEYTITAESEGYYFKPQTVQINSETPKLELNFTTSKSPILYFVIDDTGSMRDNIQGVKLALTEYIEILQQSIIEGELSPLSVLLTFKDQDEIHSRIVTDNLNELLEQVEALEADGGDDCAEDSVIALKQVAEEIGEGGTALIATDAPPHEGHEELDALIEQLRSKGVTINVILTEAYCVDEVKTRKRKGSGHFEKSVEIYSYIVNEVGNGSSLNIIDRAKDRTDLSEEEWLQIYKNVALNVMLGTIQPTITAVAPNKLPQNGTLDLSITASNANFNQSSIVQIEGGITVNDKILLSPNKIIANITVPANTNLNRYDMQIDTTLADGKIETAHGIGVIVIEEIPENPEIISTISLQNNSKILISGIKTNFTANTTSLEFDDSNIAITKLIVHNDTLLEAQIYITNGFKFGLHDIIVTTGNEIVTSQLLITKSNAIITTPIVKKYCDDLDEVITITCQNKVLGDKHIAPKGYIAKGKIAGHVTSEGWVSSVTILPNAILDGGIVTGYIKNQGTIANIDYRGGQLTGGNLAGNIIVDKKYTRMNLGVFEDVNLLDGTIIDGGIFTGTITGNGTIQNAIFLDDTILEGITIGEGCILPKTVQIGK